MCAKPTKRFMEVQWHNAAVQDVVEVLWCASEPETLFVINCERNLLTKLRASDGVATEYIRTPRIATVADDASVVFTLNQDTGTVDVDSLRNGARLRKLPVLPPSAHAVFATDASRDLLYVASGNDATLSVYRASDGAHIRDVALPLLEPLDLQLAVSAATTGELVVTATQQDAHVSQRSYTCLLIYENGGGSGLLRRLDRVASSMDLYPDAISALDVSGDLLYVMEAVPRDGRDSHPDRSDLTVAIGIVRVSDGRRLATVRAVGWISGMCATPTALLLYRFVHNSVTSLRLLPRLRWQPDAAVHPRFDERTSGFFIGGGDDNSQRGGGGFCRSVTTLLSLAARGGGNARIPVQPQRLPLELLCSVFALLAPVVLDVDVLPSQPNAVDGV